jgi:hypothetical protein
MTAVSPTDERPQEHDATVRRQVVVPPATTHPAAHLAPAGARFNV